MPDRAICAAFYEPRARGGMIKLESRTIARRRDHIGYPEYCTMLVDDIYRECVCFFGVKEKNDYGVMEWKARATAFFPVMRLNGASVVN